jgi:hypothetical protein
MLMGPVIWDEPPYSSPASASHGRGPPCPTTSASPWFRRPVLATNRLSSRTWSRSSAQFRRSAHRRRSPATAAPPLRLSLADQWSLPVSPTRARAGRPKQAARVVGPRPRRGRPSSELGFGFVFFFHFVTDFYCCLENIDLGFYLPKNYEINFVRIYIMCTILEKYKSGM